jgi:hypothetical protein
MSELGTGLVIDDPARVTNEDQSVKPAPGLTNNSGGPPDNPQDNTQANNPEKNTWISWLGSNWIWEPKISIPRWVILLILAFIIVIITLSIIVDQSPFENKPYDPYGTGIRFLQRRDDTGSMPTSLEERQFQMPALSTKSQLTSTPEGPNFSEYYGIDANIKNGSVMIERENFENSALSLDELEKANKGF